MPVRRAKWEAAVKTMQDTGVEMTNVQDGNAVWDGERVTLVDFSDQDAV